MYILFLDRQRNIIYCQTYFFRPIRDRYIYKIHSINGYIVSAWLTAELCSGWHRLRMVKCTGIRHLQSRVFMITTRLIQLSTN